MIFSTSTIPPDKQASAFTNSLSLRSELSAGIYDFLFVAGVFADPDWDQTSSVKCSTSVKSQEKFVARVAD